ncbi:MAG TPA: D-galactarate dehydratase, partial [Limnochordia bacterium]|nr:D-galactarate dehydratase [Limnochordia bacterium]
DAGRVLAGECRIDQAAEELGELVCRVAAGELSKPERLGHREYFVMYKHQDTPSLAAGCRA